jgi:5-formyltetrahydrofolate cyclo-ligase
LLLENVQRALQEKGLKTGEQKRAFVYISFSSEAPTDKLIQWLLDDGWAVYSPRIEDGTMLTVECGEDFELSAFGTREPVGVPYHGDMDLAIVPMLAVDNQGNRLGYGGGYYDRYLSAHPEALRLAYGFDFQILRQVPSEIHDITMDGIVTDKRIVWTRARIGK